ncbi:MAG: hypothetical protein ACRD8U_09125, partial [Pyrinomonadaceae bacterium]
MKNFPILFNFFMLLLVLYPIFALIYFLAGFSYGIYVLLAAIGPIIFLIMRVVESGEFVDNKLRSILGNLKEYSAYSKSLPGYRFVDIHNAVASLASQPPESVVLETQHTETLADILNRAFYTEANRRMKTPEKVARSISERDEGF